MQKILISNDSTIKSASIKNGFLTDSSKKNIVTKEYFVSRSEKPLVVELKTDTATKTIYLKPRNSFAFWFNIVENYGLGMLIDKDSPKRYGYPTRIFFSLKDSTIKHSSFLQRDTKGMFNWTVSVPYINSFYLKTKDAYKSSGGFLGIETGVEYYYKNKSYLSANIGAAIDFLVPFPVPIDYWGERQAFSTTYFSIRNNHSFERLSVGYGINFSQLKWTITNSSDSTFIPQTQKNFGCGLSLSSAYRIGNYFSIGLLYQPMLFNLNNKPALDYQHFISAELILKIPTKTGSKHSK